MALIWFEDGRRLRPLELAAVAWFNMWLVLSTLILYSITTFTLAACKVWPPKVQRQVSALLLRCCRFFWRWPFSMSPWIRIECEGLEAGWGRKLGASGKPVLIVGNHTSFMDTLLFASQIDFSTISQLATLANSQLFKIWFLGTVMRGVGHMPVHFKKVESETDFSTDPTKKDTLLSSIERHVVTHHGWVCMYPEGQIHRGFGSHNTGTLQPFRIGGLQMALQYDMELWAWVTKGNNDCWPRTAIGGLPSKISARLIPIAPSGSLDLMRELDQNAPLEYGPDELRGRVPVLAAHLQHLMQSALDDLYHKEKARDV